MHGNKLINNVKTTLLLAGMGGLIVAIGSYFGGMGGATIALVIALGINLMSYFFSHKLAIAAARAQEVGPEHDLYRMVQQLAQRANMPMPRVYISPEQAPNAFATGRNPKNGVVCATEGLLRVLNRNEVAGVMAHELAHIKHRDILTSTIAAGIGTAISYLAQFAMFFGGGAQSDEEEGGSPFGVIGLILLVILAPIAAMIIQMAISRQREYAADTEGGAIAGDPMYLATALEKIHAMAKGIPVHTPPAMNAMMIAEPKNAFGASVAGLFSTHPPLEKRLQNLIGKESTGTAHYAY
jgi:heat shock protein HtpX